MRDGDGYVPMMFAFLVFSASCLARARGCVLGYSSFPWLTLYTVLGVILSIHQLVQVAAAYATPFASRDPEALYQGPPYPRLASLCYLVNRREALRPFSHWLNTPPFAVTAWRRPSSSRSSHYDQWPAEDIRSQTAG